MWDPLLQAIKAFLDLQKWHLWPKIILSLKKKLILIILKFYYLFDPNKILFLAIIVIFDGPKMPLKLEVMGLT